jgi:hypothetical protein
MLLLADTAVVITAESIKTFLGIVVAPSFFDLTPPRRTTQTTVVHQ